MDFADLVQTITEKVLAELRASSSPAPTEASGPRVLALAAPDFAHAAALEAKIRAGLGQNIRLKFFEPESESAGARQKAAGKFDRYVMPYLCCPDMAALATGRATGPITRKALDLMLAGEKVAVLEFEYTRHADTAPRALYSLYQGYEKNLAAFGLVKFTAEAPARVRLHDSLITEKSVRDAAGSGAKSLSVQYGAIVTALARDAAQELGIEILKDGAI